MKTPNMAFDGLVLSAVTAQVESVLKGGRLQKVRQHNDTDLTLEIYSHGTEYNLFFSIDPRFARVYFTSTNYPVPQQAPSFCMLLRKYIGGMFLADAQQMGMDRILKLHFAAADAPKLTLIFELMGKHSNIILISPDNRILGAIKHVGSSISRERQILPGREYIPPPAHQKANPIETSKKLFSSLWGNETSKNVDEANNWLVSSFAGISPLLASEIVFRASKGDESVEMDMLWQEFSTISKIAANAEFKPILLTDDIGNSKLIYPIPFLQFDSANQHPLTDISTGLDTFYRTTISHKLLDDEKNALLAGIKRTISSREHSVNSAYKTLDESQRAQRYKQIGDLILGSIHLMERGSKSVELIDYYDPEMKTVTIELDEKISPQENADRYFKRYRKAKDSVSSALSRIEALENEIKLLKEAEQQTYSADNTNAIRSIQKHLTQTALLREEKISLKTGAEFEGFKVKRIYTADGWEILYGENATSNDYITQKLAKPNDIWLHTRSITGSHVVIKTGGKAIDVPRTVIMQAAKIAAQNSDAKHSSLVPVDYTRKKHVRKPRGSAAGFVTYKQEKTIDVSLKI